MSNLHLSALLVAEGLLTREELASLRAELPDDASLEDALIRRGLVDQDTLDRLLSLAETPAPEEGTVTIGTPTDHTATVWELEAPEIEALEAKSPDDEVSMDAVTGRFDGGRLAGKTTSWAARPAGRSRSRSPRKTRPATGFRLPSPIPRCPSRTP